MKPDRHAHHTDTDLARLGVAFATCNICLVDLCAHCVPNGFGKPDHVCGLLFVRVLSYV